MIDNYPPGAANDPNAPWNQKDPVMTEWECDSMGTCKKCEEHGDLNEDDICEKCFESEEIEDADGD